MSRSSQGIRAAMVHGQMLELERSLAMGRFEVLRPSFGGDNPKLRDFLLRAGAAWLIGWASLMAIIAWMPGVGLR